MSQFTTTRRVQFSETDMAGIVHFANFYRWMEEAEHDFFRSKGLTIVASSGPGEVIGWPRVSASCSFEAPARYAQLIDVHLVLERIGVKSLTYGFEFRCEGRLLARGRMKTACCRCTADGKLTSLEIPSEYRAVLHESPATPASGAEPAP